MILRFNKDKKDLKRRQEAILKIEIKPKSGWIIYK